MAVGVKCDTCGEFMATGGGSSDPAPRGWFVIRHTTHYHVFTSLTCSVACLQQAVTQLTDPESALCQMLRADEEEANRKPLEVPLDEDTDAFVARTAATRVQQQGEA